MKLLNGIVAFSLVWTSAGVISASAYGYSTDEQAAVTAVKTTHYDACRQGTKKKGVASSCIGPARGLASLAPSAEPMGQGEAMLNSVTSSSPHFLRGQGGDQSSGVKIAGVCHDTDGVVYHSGQKGYSECLDSRTTNTGNVSDYFSAQRQAGAGILIGK